jgi:hypothetical protein
MFPQITVPTSGDEILANRAGQCQVPAPEAVALTSYPQLTSDAPDIVRDVGGRLPVFVTMPQHPTRRARFPVGIVGYLASVTIVATATIGVFFGVGLLSLVKSTEAIIPGVADNSSSDVAPPFAAISGLFDSSSSSEEKAPGAQREPGLSESAAVAALPPAPPTQLADPAGERPNPVQETLPQASQAMPPTPMAGDSAGAAQTASSEGETPAAGATEASVGASAAAADLLEPASRPSAAVPQPPRLVLSAVEISELLARGDAFLRMGDLASARLYYERAADAGNGQGAMRMGATFDPSFLGRAGSRSAQGDLVQARAWYRKALDLSMVEIQRQSGTVEKR